jgi:O-methyltransferase
MTADPLEYAMWVADAERHIAAAREPRAAGPGRDPQELRRAYLDLLKLALCELVGTATTSVGALPEGGIAARELRGDEQRLRSAGMDWPLHGLTMVGLGRLDDLQACVESVVADGVEGDMIEAGAWRGGASLLMRATLDTLGDDRTVWVADSFQGFPQPDGDDSEAHRVGALDFLAVPQEEVAESFDRLGLREGVRLVPGFFEDTLPGLADRRWSLIRLDADTYEPTRLSLDLLYPSLAVGGYLVLDDYGAFQGCRRAVDQFREENGITEPIERIDFAGARWRRESDAQIRATAPVPRRERPQRAATEPRTRPVPTQREVELERELAGLRDRLAAAEAQIGLRPWLRRRVRSARR